MPRVIFNLSADEYEQLETYATEDQTPNDIAHDIVVAELLRLGLGQEQP